MVQRLTGKNAVSSSQAGSRDGIRQQNLSRWLQEARSLPIMADKPEPVVASGPSSRRLVFWPMPPNLRARS